MIKRSIFQKTGGFQIGFDGSQDHDLILRVIEHTDEIYHIPKILYHWRKIPGSTAAVYDSKSYAWEAGRKAIEGFIKRQNIPGKVFLGRYQGSYRVKRDLQSRPVVSILIPFKDKPALLKKCIGAILELTTYPQFEIIGISNSSKKSETFQLMNYLNGLDERIRFEEYNIPFNFSRINNYGVEKASGEHIIFLNNDIEVTTPDWIETLLEHSQRREVGAVGAKLYYPDETLQHAGVIIGLYGNAGHSHKFFKKYDLGYYSRVHVQHNVSAVTAALMMVAKKKFHEVGGFDEANLGVAYNDVDFCLQLRKNGYFNVFTPYCEAIHHESASRGYETTVDKMKRFKLEKKHFEKRWHDEIQKGDPYYNKNLTLKSEDYSIRV